jgi:hypothetical protein
MHACDGKVMKDERGHDVIPCECRYNIKLWLLLITYRNII